MMAEVGGMVNVRGSRIATPLAPPRPGRTPMMTPSRMPTSIRAKLYQERATLKPPMSELISSTSVPSRRFPNASQAGAGLQLGCYPNIIPSVWYTLCQVPAERNIAFIGPATFRIRDVVLPPYWKARYPQ